MLFRSAALIPFYRHPPPYTCPMECHKEAAFFSTEIHSASDEYALQEEDLPVLFEEYDKLAAEMVRRTARF